MVEKLIAAGVDVNVEGMNELTALRAAAENGHLEVVEKLLAAGANVNPKSADYYRDLAARWRKPSKPLFAWI
jgi:ankyrin repeat protein